MRNIIVKLLEEGSGNETAVANLVRSRGDFYWEGATVTQKTSLYSYFTIVGTGNYLITVNPVGWVRRIAAWRGMTPTSCVINLSRDEHNLCYKDGRLVSDRSSIIFTPNAFQSSKAFLQRNRDADIYCESLLGRTILHDTFKDGVIDVFASTAVLDNLIATHEYRTDTIYYQLVTTAGVHRIYPGLTIPDKYDPLQEAWFARCKDSSNEFVVGLPERQPFGFERHGISFCSKLRYHTGDLYGVLNVVLTIEKAWNILTQHVTAQCESSLGCFIMNEAGLIIFDRDWFKIAQSSSAMFNYNHVMCRRPQIGADLVSRGRAESRSCADMNIQDLGLPRLYTTWRIQIDESSFDRDWYKVQRISNTNAFLVLQTRTPDEQQDCSCPQVPQVTSCKADDVSCYGPCHTPNLNEYEICSGMLRLSADSHRPCPIAAYNYSFTDIVTNERINGASSSSSCQGSTGSNSQGKQQNSSDKAWIAGVVVPILLLIILVVVIFFIVRHKIKSGQKEDKIYQDIVYTDPSGASYDPSNDATQMETSLASSSRSTTTLSSTSSCTYVSPIRAESPLELKVTPDMVTNDVTNNVTSDYPPPSHHHSGFDLKSIDEPGTVMTCGDVSTITPRAHTLNSIYLTVADTAPKQPTQMV